MRYNIKLYWTNRNGEKNTSFDKIEQIANALGVHSFELFIFETGEKKEKKPKTKDYLLKMPNNVKKEIISNLLFEIKNNLNTSLEPDNY